MNKSVSPAEIRANMRGANTADANHIPGGDES